MNIIKYAIGPIMGILIWYMPAVKSFANKKQTATIQNKSSDYPSVYSLLNLSTEEELQAKKRYEDDYTLPDNLPPMLEDDKVEVSSKLAPVKAVKVDASYRVDVTSMVSSQVLDRHLKGVLKEKGEKIIAECHKNNICALFLTAILMHESANGQSQFAREKNNVSGIFLKGKYHIFDSVDDCIEFTAKLLGGKMYAGGKNKTILGVQKVYCPVGAKNDPKGLNQHWLSGVIGYIHKLWGKEVYVRA